MRVSTPTLAAQLVAACTLASFIGASFATPGDVMQAPPSPSDARKASPTTIAAGDASVSTQTGALTYSYPVSVPPSRLGSNAPSIALTYSSQGAVYGGLAAGWDLSIPYIATNTRAGRVSQVHARRQYTSSLAGGHPLLRVIEPSGAGVEDTYRAQYDSSYARYERLTTPDGRLAFRVRHADGSVYEFGDTAFIGGYADYADADFAPLTRTIDKFGNTVDYHWAMLGGSETFVIDGAPEPPPTFGIEYVLTKIQYTGHIDHGVSSLPAARVEFGYGLDPTCEDMPPGAELSRRDGVARVRGRHRLNTITTYAPHPDTGARRAVRRYDLRYDDEAPRCDGKHGPQRLLRGITEVGIPYDGGPEHRLPEVAFDYGVLERQWVPRTFELSPPYAGAPQAVAWGTRNRLPNVWPGIQGMMMDVDGDGVLDRPFTPPSGAAIDTDGDGVTDRVFNPNGGDCGFVWQRGDGTGFGPMSGSDAYVELPSLLVSPGFAGFEQTCSLTGQRVHIQTRDGSSCGAPNGSYLAYRFLNVVGKDDLPDIAVALHYDSAWFSPSDPGARDFLASMGLPVPDCDASAPACPILETQVSACMDLATDGRLIDEHALAECLDGAVGGNCFDTIASTAAEGDGDEDCEEGSGETSEDCDDKKDDDEPKWNSGYLPGADVGSQSDIPGDAPHPSCRAPRLALRANSCDYQHVWWVFENLGGGRYATTPRVVLSPVPLEADSDSSSTGTSQFSVTSGEHAIIDLNGDGHLDVISTDDVYCDPAISSCSAPATLWYVFLGDGDGHFRGPDPDHPYYWLAPTGAAPGGGGAAGDGEFTLDGRARRFIVSWKGLLDANGDGLHDYLHFSNLDAQFRVYFNDGASFLEDGMWRPDEELPDFGRDTGPWLTIGMIEIPTIGTDDYVPAGTRFVATAPVDWDGDGRLDFHRYRDRGARPLDEPCPVGVLGCPALLFNAGQKVLQREFLMDEIEGWSREKLDADETSWRVLRRFQDYTGDGTPDILTCHDGSGNDCVVRTEPVGAPPMRLLHTIDNGRGLITSVTYAPHTDPAVVEQDPATKRAVSRPTWVVAAITTEDMVSDAPASTTSYRYRFPRTTVDNLGLSSFRGFDEVIAIGPRGARTIDRFDYELDWSGRKVESVVEAGPDDGSFAASIQRTTWGRYKLGSWNLYSFQPQMIERFACAQGSTYDDCLAADVRVADVTVWATVGTAHPLLAVSQQWSIAGDFELVDGVVTGYTPAPGDVLAAHIHELRADDDEYILVTRSTWRRDLAEGRSMGRVEWVYDPSLRVVHQERVEVRPGVWAATDRGYDMTLGLLTSVTKPEQRAAGLATTFEYDPTGTFVTATINELGHRLETDYDFGTGAVLETRGPNRADRAGSTIDAFGRPTSSWRVLDDESLVSRVVTLAWTTYHDASPATGTPERVEHEALIDEATGLRSHTEEEYDGRGRLIARVTEAGSVDAVELLHYDVAGDVVEIEIPDASRDDAARVSYTFIYDTLGRMTASRDADGNGIDVAFLDPEAGAVPRVTTRTEHIAAPFTDADGISERPAQTVTRSDAHGRLMEVKELLADGGFATTRYTHDAADRLVHVENADGVLTDLEHDFAGNRTRIVRGARTWLYSYDLNGNLRTQVAPHPEGAFASLYTVSTVYDALDRPTSQLAGTRALSTTDAKLLHANVPTYFTYDTGVNGIGRLASVQWRRLVATGWFPYWEILRGEQFLYDARGLTREHTRSFDLRRDGLPFRDERTVRARYNAAGAVSRVEHADGTTITRTDYDVRGLPATVSWERSRGTRLLARYTRNPAGRARTITAPEYTREFMYRWNGAVRAQTGRRSSDGAMLFAEHVEYYAMGDPRRIGAYREGYPYRATDYRYDTQHQLLRANGAGYEADFAYSPGGQLELAAVAVRTGPNPAERAVRYDYTGSPDPEAVDELLDDDGVYAAYEYTSTGAIERRATRAGTWQFGYDGYDRQRWAEDPNNATELYYYGQGADRWLAVELRPDGRPRRARFWLGDDEIHYDATGTVEKTLAHVSAGTPIARIDNGTTLEYSFHNGLGHLMAAMSAATGRLTAAYVYGPFGELLWQSGNPDDHLRRFNGKIHDNLSSLAFYGHRYYDQQSLLFTRADPMYRFIPDAAAAEPRRMNLYTFSLNNPLRYVDPDGLGNVAAPPMGAVPAVGACLAGGCQALASGAAAVAPVLLAAGVVGVMVYVGAQSGVDGGVDQYCKESFSASCADRMRRNYDRTRDPSFRRERARARRLEKEAKARQEAHDTAKMSEGEEPVTDPGRLLPERAGPTGEISPTEVSGKTPGEIDARARELGLEPRGPDPAKGRGAYIDPQTGKQRILSHPEASPPHGHVNNPAGERIGPDGTVVPPESPEAHLPIETN